MYLKPDSAVFLQTLGKVMALHSGTSISYDIEPFLKTYGEKATDSAYPHANSPLPVSTQHRDKAGKGQGKSKADW